MNLSQVIQAWLVTPILNEIKKVEAQVSALSDAVTAVNTEVTTLVAGVTQLGTDLTAEIARLQALIAAGNVTPADLANLTTIATNLKAITATVAGLDTQATGA